MEQKAHGDYDGFFDALRRFAERYRADAAVRARVAAGDHSDLDLELPAGAEVRVLEQSADTFYFPLPPASGAAVSDEALAAVSGGTGIPGAAIPYNVLGPCFAPPLPDGFVPPLLD